MSALAAKVLPVLDAAACTISVRAKGGRYLCQKRQLCYILWYKLVFAENKYSRVMDLVSSGNVVTMMVRTTDGASATIASSFMVF